MEPSTPNKLAKPLTIAGILVVIAGIIGFTGMDKKDDTTQPVSTSTDTNAVASDNTTTEAGGKYKDGTYTAQGNYVSPGGAEHVGVKLTIKDDTVVASEFTAMAENPSSVMMQGQFASGYKEFVIGKKLDDLVVGKVSGSSLTPKGFNDAVAKIKVEAKS